MTEGRSPVGPADRSLRVVGLVDGLGRFGIDGDHGELALATERKDRAEAPCRSGLPRHRRGMTQLLRFAYVGVASTAAFTLLYLALRGIGVTAQPANAVSQLVTAVGNTAANRRLTFGIRGSAHLGRHQMQGLIAFGVGLLVTSATLAVLHAVTARPSRAIEVSALVIATVGATVVRFALYKSWVFRPRRRS
jgi:putative flippase GtrA